MIKAVIKNGDESLLLDLPYKRTEIYEQLGSVGIWNPQGDVFIRDRDNEKVSVKLFSDGNINFENRLIGLFNEDTTLASVNNVCEAVRGLSEEQQDELNYDLAHDEYDNLRDMLGAVMTMKMRKPQKMNENYYCKLQINMPDDDGYEMCECDNSIGVEHINDIKALLFDEQNRGDPMIEYFSDNPAIKAKLKSAVWDVEEKNGELYGVIRCRYKAPLTEAEESEWKIWISGQCSDGLCEGVEQRPIKTDDAEIYVSFWSDSDWQLMNEQEFESHLLQEQTGGMQL